MTNGGSTRPGAAQRWINAGLLAIIAGAMLALILLAYQTIGTERATRERATQTGEVLMALRNVNSAALNGETGQRGYILTLDRRYLEPYLAARDRIDPALASLRASLGSQATPRQIELYDQIDALARAKFAEMAESVALVQRGDLLAARRAMLTDEGVESMERLRRSVREMEQIEGRLLADASADTEMAEARVLPLLSGLLVLLMAAMIAGVRLVGRAARAEAEAAQAFALEEARDRADLLASELNHRVKNLFAVVLAIVQMSARDRPEAKEVAAIIGERIRALLTAHEVTQGEATRPVASLAALVETTLAPYRSASHPARIEGPAVMLPSKRVTPLGLVLHELTTNAVKYGAWAHGGEVSVHWEKRDGRILLCWQETGVPLAEGEQRKGFGTMLMTSAARQFGGSVERTFGPDGLTVSIELPDEG